MDADDGWRVADVAMDEGNGFFDNPALRTGFDAGCEVSLKSEDAELALPRGEFCFGDLFHPGVPHDPL